jgi:hypothetical protein
VPSISRSAGSTSTAAKSSGWALPPASIRTLACGLRGKVKRAMPVRVVAVSSVSIAPPRTGLRRTE